MADGGHSGMGADGHGVGDHVPRIGPLIRIISLNQLCRSELPNLDSGRLVYPQLIPLFIKMDAAHDMEAAREHRLREEPAATS